MEMEPFMPMPEGGFKEPHEAAPACSDAMQVASIMHIKHKKNQYLIQTVGSGCYMVI